jgi:hypothetical protein
MTQQEYTEVEDTAAAVGEEFGDLGLWPVPRPIYPIPFRPLVSGLYTWQWRFHAYPIRTPEPIPIIPQPIPEPPIPIPQPQQPFPVGPGGATAMEAREELSPIFPWWWQREELRLDIDGRYPQMAASGTLFSGIAVRVHWIAELTAIGMNQWSGPIWYKEGNALALPYTNVTIAATPNWFPNNRKATVTFTGGGQRPRVKTFAFTSRYFHEVEFEYDSVPNSDPQQSINTCDHPNRPASLPCETLSLDAVYRRAGFRVTNSGGNATVPLAGAGANATWSDTEMHDAMQMYWSKFANKAQWSMWVLWAARHDRGTSLGGIMFDDIGPNHRQGTAIFTDSFISDAPATEPASSRDAWVARMRFWTAAHEMGHAFNLAHAWQKEHPASWGTSWIPLVNDDEARSWMNYPFNVSGGESSFFSDFSFRFIDDELLFMRHAPARFVQMGNADWFENHGFEQAFANTNQAMQLKVRPNRDRSIFEFLEPVILELKLTNVGADPVIVDAGVINDVSNLTVVIQRKGDRARQWTPYARHCIDSELVTLDPGESHYQSIPVFAGQNGWDLAEPGLYRVEVMMNLGDFVVVSNQAVLRVAASADPELEALATDFFTEDVGRTLVFGGTKVLVGANKTLEDLVDRVPERRVAAHANFALSNPLTYAYKTLSLDGGAAPTSVHQAGGKFSTARKKPDQALEGLQRALLEAPEQSAETMGHIEYKKRVDDLCSFLEQEGDPAAAASTQDKLYDVMSARQVLPEVLHDIDDRRKELRQKTPQADK